MKPKRYLVTFTVGNKINEMDGCVFCYWCFPSGEWTAVAHNVFFLQQRSHDDLRGIFPLSFYNLCKHMHVNAVEFQRISSHLHAILIIVLLQGLRSCLLDKK